MIVQQLPQMPAPSINQITTSHEWVSGRGEPRSNSKSTCTWNSNS